MKAGINVPYQYVVWNEEIRAGKASDNQQYYWLSDAFSMESERHYVLESK